MFKLISHWFAVLNCSILMFGTLLSYRINGTALLEVDVPGQNCVCCGKSSALRRYIAN